MDSCGQFRPYVFQNEIDGYIQSPYYPDSYPNNLNCSWLIKVQREESLTLSLLDVQLQSR